jgi:3-oxoacyl-[acyl-carrier-protein] synthase II
MTGVRSRAVAVSGLGAVGPWGIGRAALAAALAAPDALAGVEVDRAARFHRPGGARTALLARGFDLQPLLPPGGARRVSPPARFALAAARLALADAGLADLARAEHARTAVVAGTAFGPPWVTEQLLSQIFELGPEAASPALFTESVASASASQVALALGARGPTLTLTCREASDLVALAEGTRLVRSGAAERALVVVVDEMIPLLHALLDRFGALARPDASGRERARPFDRARRGALAAEGAVAALVEPSAAVAARGGRALCEVAAAGSGFDPTAAAWRFGDDSEALARGLRRGLERAGAPPEAIDLVAAGASGSRRGDRLLGRALARLFDSPPPVAAPKARLGEYGGGFLGAALLHAAGARVERCPGGAEADPEIGLAPHDGSPLPPPRATLAATVAAGGAWAWALLRRGSE